MPSRQVKQKTKQACAARAKWQCFRCGELVDSHYEIDHHVPLHLNGSNKISNLVLLCLHCHREKTQLEMLALTPSDDNAILRRRVGASFGWTCQLCEDRLDARFKVHDSEPMCSSCACCLVKEPRTKSVRRCKNCKIIYSAWFPHQCN